MLNAFIKLLVSKLNNLLLLGQKLQESCRIRPFDVGTGVSKRYDGDEVCCATREFALTGFVCTYKIQAEEECLSSNVLCYECDSRYDPNCADPFELSSLSLVDQQSLLAAQANNNSKPTNAGEVNPADDRQQRVPVGTVGNNSNLVKILKKYPSAAICHGCCVKITSKTPEGATYVKRTCTTNLQINYFMVGLVCMKESGDRGKMCFCETDYCNGSPSEKPAHVLVFSMLMIGLIMSTRRLVPSLTDIMVFRYQL